MANRSIDSQDPVRVAFVMEQQVGHRTYYENLRRAIDTHPGVVATWVAVTYEPGTQLWERLPVMPLWLRGALRGRDQVRKALRHADCDAAFYNTQVPAVLAGASSGRVPYVITTDITPIQYDRMSRYYGHRADRPSPLSWYKHRANVTTFRRATKVLPWSAWVGGSLQADYGVAPERICITPSGVDLEKWQAKSAYSHTAPLKALFVGGDFHRKGGDTLLRAFQSLPAGSVELHVVTRSPIEPAEGVRVYRDMAPNSPALVALFHNADVFVLPTLAEAFGIVAMEAGASGLPVIATRVGGLAEVVADGVTGFLIQPGDSAALAERLLRFLEDPELCERMGRAARANAVQRFDVRAIAGRVVNVLREAASVAGRRGLWA
jgi:glycosyltransferase involved in cell wall biosynthesis